MIWDLRRKLRRLLAPALLALLSVALSVIVVQMLGLIRPRQDPLLMLDLQSNYVDFRVSRPGAATVALRGGWVPRAPDCLDPAGRDVTPLAALLAPAQGTRVEYIWAPRTVSLRYSGPPGDPAPFVTIIRDGAADCPVSGRDFVVILPHAALADMAPLPILGAGRIGVETAIAAPPTPVRPRLLPVPGAPPIEAIPSPGNFLHGGTVSVYGRASRADPPAVFRVSEADFQIPRGSRVDFGLGRDATAQNGGDRAAGDVLRGTAALAGSGPGLSVQAVTSASDVQISGLAGVTTFAAGAVVTAVSDPTIAPLLLFVASFIYLYSTLITIYQLVSKRD